MTKKDLVSAADLTRADLVRYLELAARVEESPREELARLLPGCVLAALFFEPSTRTRLSFESAMCRLGGSAIGFAEPGATSVKKGETLLDTMRTVECYCDAIVVRHPREGVARIAAEAVGVPVINASDGSNQHPSQTLLDLYTIQRLFGRLDGVRVALAGDLKYSRTVHSLVQAFHLLGGARLVLASPAALRLPDHVRYDEGGSPLAFEETDDLREAIASADVLYMTRIQRERFPDPVDYEKVKDAFLLDASMLEGVPAHFRVLHPLPRVNEIALDVDATPHAAYFEQVRNGVTMRQAILLHLLGVWA